MAEASQKQDKQNARNVAELRQRALLAMREPGFYPHGPDTVRLRETHISHVFLAGEYVYKVKKALALPFLDYRNLKRRRFFCQEEVRLNRRLAPDTYLGVRSIIPRDGGFTLGEVDDADAVEYAVEMRRLPEGRTLNLLIESGKVGEREIGDVAHLIARFHDQAERAPQGWGGPADVKAQLDENFETVLPYVGSIVEPRIFTAVERFSNAFVLNQRDFLVERVDKGRVREGHGDLRAGHIVMEGDKFTVFDCVDFDERLRYVDVASDLAFLYMDLERLGAGGLASELERAYIDASGDIDLRRLLPFYASYRSWVRGKTACLRAGQLGDGGPRHEKLREIARSLFSLAHRFAWRARLPLVLVFCGVAATGKSTLAEAISEESGFAHLCSDVIRKGLADVPVDERGGKEIYEEGFSVRTYEELARRARAEVEAGRGAIVDATFVRRQYRRSFLDALRPTGARALFIECQAPLAVLIERAKRREHAPERGSDALPYVVQHQTDRFEALSEVPAQDHLLLRTDRPVKRSLDEVESFVNRA